MPKSTLWREPVLKVFFMGPEQEKFIYDGAELKSFKVMEIVQEGWNFDDMENGEYVPTFKQVSKASDAHIRVLFKSTLISKQFALPQICFFSPSGLHDGNTECTVIHVSCNSSHFHYK